jgi:hypothetical protein
MSFKLTAVDSKGYVSTGDSGKRKALPGYMRPVKILILMNHIIDICDAQKETEAPHKPDGFSNIAIEEFEKYGVVHGKTRVSNDLCWLSTMEDAYKVDPAVAMAPPPPPRKAVEVKTEDPRRYQ